MRYLLLFVLTLAVGCQRSREAAISVSVNPSEATIRSGQTQSFTAVVDGMADRIGTRWEVQEQDGGYISQDGVYTAPKISGVYHVVATTKADPHARAVVKVTVI